MRRARIARDGQVLEVICDAEGRPLDSTGECIRAGSFTWLPPATGTMLALGLNYADHAAELDFKPPAEPLIFVKAPNTYTGHDQVSCRPDGVGYMHYEAELVAVIGRPTRRVSRADALACLAGYTVCNDYAIRDYLENYYRPNLRVKSRDGLTPIGPWLVDCADVPDPGNLAVRTRVNGELRQSGNTRDMIFDIPYLIEYISAFMTLMPGDMIATGTPTGVSDVKVSDLVEVEVEGIGRLSNTIVSEAHWHGRG